MKIKELLSRLTYKPGWTFEAKRRDPFSTTVIIRFKAPDSDNPNQIIDLVKSVMIDDRCPDPLWMLRHVIHDIEDHEMAEWLKIDGKRIIEPHKEPK